MWGDEEGGWFAFWSSFGLVSLAKGIHFSIVDGDTGEKAFWEEGKRVST